MADEEDIIPQGAKLLIEWPLDLYRAVIGACTRTAVQHNGESPGLTPMRPFVGLSA